MTGLEVILPYLAAAGAAVGAVATVSAAESQASAQEYNASIAEQHAVTARSQANDREEAQRAHGRQVIGQQLAATAQSGTSLNGTNLDLLSQSLYGVEVDAMNIRYEGALKASGLNAQASLDRSQADSTRTGGYLSAAGKLIGGSSSYISGDKKVPSYGGVSYYPGGGMLAVGSGD